MFLFNSLTDAEVVFFTYLGMVAALVVLVALISVPAYKLAQRRMRRSVDQTARIIADTAARLDPFGIIPAGYEVGGRSGR